jgi:3-oxoacyl-[acyl-carrier-protein] synthase II
VVVTGLGPLSAAGAGSEPLWRALQSAPSPPSQHRASLGGRSWGSYSAHLPEWRPHHAASPDLPADAELVLAVAALRLAIADAGLPTPLPDSTALVLTYEAPGMERLLRGVLLDLMEPAGGALPAVEGLDAAYRRHKDAVYHTHSFLHLHLAARALAIHGPVLFLNNACASGLYALEAAADQLRLGRCTVALAAAAEMPDLPTKQLWFEEARVYSPTGRLRPFDRERDGLVLGGAGAALVLETLEAARARGARIYAEYLGGASTQEGWKVAVPNLTERWYEETLRRTLRAAAVEPAEIDLLNPHGAGTGLGDLAEARGLTAVFGPWPRRPRITAFKPYFGHTLGASALLETAALLLSLENGLIPATPGFATPDPELEVRCVERAERAELRTVVKMSSGFAGFNAGAVFRRVEESR